MRRKLFFKLAILSAPLLVFLTFYLFFDPFMVLYHYDNYYTSDRFKEYGISRDYISTQHFINTANSTSYNAFLFGSSHSLQYTKSSWQKHIGNQNIYHFDAQNESVLGILQKMELVLKNKKQIDFAVLILDKSIIERTKNDNDALFCKHPKLTNQKYIQHQAIYLKQFYKPKYLKYFFKTLLNPLSKNAKTKQEIEKYYDLSSNEISFLIQDDLIKIDSTAFYKEREDMYYLRPLVETMGKKAINETCINLLNKIAVLLKEQGTKYKIVIPPLFDQELFNSIDLQQLKNIFGSANVFDFSGKNNFTEEKGNYYEGIHARVFIADKVLDSIYK